MADKASEYELGYKFSDAETRGVYYTETIAAGDYLKVTGVTDEPELTLKVAVQTLATAPRFMALFPGKADERHQALHRGTTKTTLGETVVPGDRMGVTANKALKDSTAATSNACGYIITGGDDDDTGLVHFDGELA